MLQNNLSLQTKKKITEYGNLMANLLTGDDLKFKNRNGIKTPNSDEQKIRRIFKLFKSLCQRQDGFTFCVFIDGTFENMKASEYLKNRLDYIDKKIKNNRFKPESRQEIVLVAIMILGSVWGILVWDLWQSKEGNRIKKVIKSLGCFMACLAYIFIWTIFIISLFVCLPLEILCYSLVVILFLFINAFFTVRLWHKIQSGLCREFKDKREEIKNFINEYYYDVQQDMNQDAISDAETEISQEDNQSENSELLPTLNDNSFIIAFDKSNQKGNFI